MKYFDKKAEEIWKNHVISNLEKIKVNPGKCRYNYRCHNNAVHDAIQNKDNKFAVVIYIDGRTSILHFINYAKGQYTDNTLGHWSTHHDYYFLRWINKDQFNADALTIFDEIRTEWTKKIPWIWRWLVNAYI